MSKKDYDIKIKEKIGIKVGEIPEEVMWYACVYQRSINFGVGGETIKRMREIEDKYPDWFVWEHKYRAIPLDVHAAYETEKRGPDVVIGDLPEGGWFKMINEAVPVPLEFNFKSFEQMLTDHYDGMRKEYLLKQEQRKKDKSLWDKHYKKYGLKYRG